jgi:hypothetical protein
MEGNSSRWHTLVNLSRAIFASTLCGASLFLAQEVGATAIATQFVRAAPYYWGGVAFDSVTGDVYELPGYANGYGRTGNTFTVYSSIAQFEAGTPSGSVATSSNTWGTYAVANGGELYARTASAFDGSGFPIDAQTTEFSAITGSAIQTVNPPNLGGVNGPDSFDWGGFSAVDALSDGNRLYVVSHTASGAPGDWTIDTYDFGLNLLDTSQVTLAIGQPGFAFAIDGALFFGDDYNSGHISSRVDPISGALTAVDFTLGPFFSGTYLSDTAYSAATDTLYLVSAGNYYKVEDASAAFGVNLAPEPPSIALLGFGLIAFVLSRTRRFGG